MILAAVVVVATAAPTFGQQPSAERGKYVFDAAGCQGCHTDKKAGVPLLAGGPPLVTPFGTFYAPNITPHKEHGIGSWTADQFVEALHSGVSPKARHYYPVFPFTAYTKASRSDLLDLWAYMATVPVSDRPNRLHDVAFPFSVRPLADGALEVAKL